VSCTMPRWPFIPCGGWCSPGGGSRHPRRNERRG
jgi:hypothetical protein